MTNSKINLSKTGTRCRICTGCGKCPGVQKMDIVSHFSIDGVKEGSPAAENAGASLACAVADIGTTTIAMQLRRGDGVILDTFQTMNPQRAFGTDVISRITAAEEKACAEQMQSIVWQVLEQGLAQFEKTAHVVALSIAGNTTMIHLLMGYEVSGLGSFPFTPFSLKAIHTQHNGIPVHILPGISAFLGGDITAGILALSMQEREEITLLLDLGTNGEMVLGNRDKMLATSTAAGPAFEGNGICYGTDLMALTARLLSEGVLDETGLLADPYFDEGILIGGVHITQGYIRQLQMAKAAIAAGVGILCEKYGLRSMEEIDRVWLAGGMGYYLDKEAAAAIGLLPKSLAEKTVAVGNTALEGAFLYGRACLGQQATESSLQVEEFNLAKEPAFESRYIGRMELAPF